MVFEIIAPNKVKTQSFSEDIGDDYNIVHREDNKRQVVAGDWSVLGYFNFYRPQELCSLIFDFVGMVSPEDKLKVNPQGIFSKEDKEIVNATSADLIQFNALHDFFEGSYQQSFEGASIEDYFPQFDRGLSKLLMHYCLASGDIGNSVLPIIMKEEDLIVNPKKKLPFMYGSSKISFDLSQITPYSQISRVLLDPVVDLNEKARGNILFSYILQDQNEIPVGYFEKTVIAKGLMRK